MLILGQQLLGKKIMSLRLGRDIAITTDVVINPNNLKIEGWHAYDPSSKKYYILLSQDVRGFVKQDFVVNDNDALSDPKELIRLKSLLKLKFTLINKVVVTDGRRRVGKVIDYALDENSLYIQKLHIGQSILKSFTGGQVIIDRSQIIEITDKKIKISEATIKDTSPIPAAA